MAHVRRFPARTIEISASWFSGAEARADFGDVARGLKPPSPSGLGSCAGAKEAAEKLGNSCRIGEKRPSAAKAGDFFVALTARLKSCPFKTFAGSRVFPLSVKPRGISIAFTAPFDFAQGRLLKSCPDTFGSRNRVFPQPVRSRPVTARSFPAVYSSMPVSAASSRSRFTSTQQCRTGGRRFL